MCRCQPHRFCSPFMLQQGVITQPTPAKVAQLVQDEFILSEHLPPCILPVYFLHPPKKMIPDQEVGFLPASWKRHIQLLFFQWSLWSRGYRTWGLELHGSQLNARLLMSGTACRQRPGKEGMNEDPSAEQDLLQQPSGRHAMSEHCEQGCHAMTNREANICILQLSTELTDKLNKAFDN